MFRNFFRGSFSESHTRPGQILGTQPFMLDIRQDENKDIEDVFFVEGHESLTVLLITD